MSENYSNPKITNPIIPPQPSDYIEEYTEPVQEPKNDGGEGDGSNDKPTPKPDNEKPQPKPDDESHHEEDAPKPEETEPKEEDEDGGHKDEEEGGLEEQNPIEDKDDAQGNFFEDNKGLLTRVYNILKLRFPNSNVSLPQLLTGAQQYIDMIANYPGHGGGGDGEQGGGEGEEEGGGQPTGTGQEQHQTATIKPEDITEDDLDEIIKNYNAINAASTKRFYDQYCWDKIEEKKEELEKKKEKELTKEEKEIKKILSNKKLGKEEKIEKLKKLQFAIELYDEKEGKTLQHSLDNAPFDLFLTISEEDKKDSNKKAILKEALLDFCNYVVYRSDKTPLNITNRVEILMYIHDYIAETIAYNNSENTLFNCFYTKKADCQHFAQALVFLCCYINHIQHKKKKQDNEQNKSNEDSFIIIDYVPLLWYNDNNIVITNNPNAHVMNCVKIDDKWYYIDVSSTRKHFEDLGVFFHRSFLHQQADFYNDQIENPAENIKRKAIGALDDLKDGNKLKSNNTTILNSYLFYDYILKKQLTNFDLDKLILDKLIIEFSNDFTKKFSKILIEDKIDSSRINSELNNRTVLLQKTNPIALLQNKEVLHIAFSFHSEINEIELIKIENPDPESNTKKTKTPLIFLFIVWLVEKMELPTIIEIITNGSINNEIQSTFMQKELQLRHILKKMQSNHIIVMETPTPSLTDESGFRHINKYYNLAYFIR